MHFGWRAISLIWGMTGFFIATLAEEPANPSEDFLAQPGSMMSDGLILAMVKRGAYELGQELELDEVQQQELREVLADRWVPFFQKHRSQMAPLADRFMQAQWDPDPPNVDEVKTWAKEALKLHELFTAELDQSNQEVAKILRPEQVARFQTQAAEFSLGLGLFKAQLIQWEQGDIDLDAWKRRRNGQEREKRRREQAVKDSRIQRALESLELTAVYVNAWDLYVVSFIQKFSLDESQRLSATTMLKDVKDRAQTYLKSRSDVPTAIETILELTALPDRQKMIAEKSETLQPLQSLFAELQLRLEQIPTEAQRSQHQATTQERLHGE